MSRRLRVRQARRREEDLSWCTRSCDIASGLATHSRLHGFQILRICVLIDAPGRLQVHGSTTDEQPTKELEYSGMISEQWRWIVSTTVGQPTHVSQPEIIVIEDSPPEPAEYN